MSAPEKIYDNACNLYIRADIHQSELDALHAECDRLTALLEPLPVDDIADDDKMFEQIEQWARQSIAYHRRQIRGQQITQADSGDYHLIMAMLRWIKESQVQKVLKAEDVTEPGLYAWRKGKNKPTWWALVSERQIYNPHTEEMELQLCRRIVQHDKWVQVVSCGEPGEFIGPIKMPEVEK